MLTLAEAQADPRLARKVRPGLARRDVADALLANSKELGDCSLAKSFLSEHLQNIKHFLGCQFCGGVRLAKFSKVAAHAPTLFCHVSHVGRVRVNPKVRWIYAPRIVASVQNTESLWDQSKVQNPSSYMGSYRAASACAKPNKPITLIALSSNPIPARPKFRAVFRNGAMLVKLLSVTLPKRNRKTIRQGWILNKLPQLDKLAHSLSSCRAALPAHPAFLFSQNAVKSQ